MLSKYKNKKVQKWCSFVLLKCKYTDIFPKIQKNLSLKQANFAVFHFIFILFFLGTLTNGNKFRIFAWSETYIGAFLLKYILFWWSFVVGIPKNPENHNYFQNPQKNLWRFRADFADFENNFYGHLDKAEIISYICITNYEKSSEF